MGLSRQDSEMVMMYLLVANKEVKLLLSLPFLPFHICLLASCYAHIFGMTHMPEGFTENGLDLSIMVDLSNLYEHSTDLPVIFLRLLYVKLDAEQEALFCRLSFWFT